MKECFDRNFKRRGFYLPQADLDLFDTTRVYRLNANGWAIWYRFGCEDDKRYLDYYVCHRMTNDHHVRIWEDGECESLPTVGEYIIFADDPEEMAKEEEMNVQENQRVIKMLLTKGFVIDEDWID